MSFTLDDLRSTTDDLRCATSRVFHWVAYWASWGLGWAKIRLHRSKPALAALIRLAEDVWRRVSRWLSGRWASLSLRVRVLVELRRQHRTKTRFILNRVLGPDRKGRDVLVPHGRFGGIFAAVQAAGRKMNEGVWGDWCVTRVRTDVVLARVSRVS